MTSGGPGPGDSVRIVLLMGVSGCGKSTIGARLSRCLGWPFRDADSFHPAANVDKMSRGQPLTDEDRWPWLDAIGTWMDDQRRHGCSAIVSCSALKRVYRQRLFDGRPQVRLVYLQGSKSLIADRMQGRRNHFMPPALLDSQFAALEEPARDERALVVNIAMIPKRVVDTIVGGLRLD